MRSEKMLVDLQKGCIIVLVEGTVAEARLGLIPNFVTLGELLNFFLPQFPHPAKVE